MSEDEQQNQTTIRIFEDDKEFFVGKELQKYLILKHEDVAIKQEEILHLVRVEMENIMGEKVKKK